MCYYNDVRLTKQCLHLSLTGKYRNPSRKRENIVRSHARRLGQCTTADVRMYDHRSVYLWKEIIISIQNSQ